MTLEEAWAAADKALRWTARRELWAANNETDFEWLHDELAAVRNLALAVLEEVQCDDSLDSCASCADLKTRIEQLGQEATG